MESQAKLTFALGGWASTVQCLDTYSIYLVSTVGERKTEASPVPSPTETTSLARTWAREALFEKDDGIDVSGEWHLEEGSRGSRVSRGLNVGLRSPTKQYSK